jgi:hypothetical protein
MAALRQDITKNRRGPAEANEWWRIGMNRKA